MLVAFTLAATSKKCTPTMTLLFSIPIIPPYFPMLIRPFFCVRWCLPSVESLSCSFSNIAAHRVNSGCEEIFWRSLSSILRESSWYTAGFAFVPHTLSIGYEVIPGMCSFAILYMSCKYQMNLDTITPWNFMCNKRGNYAPEQAGMM